MTLSGKFVLRIPPALHQRIKEEAKTRNISLNQFIIEHLNSLAGSKWSECLGVIRAALDRDLIGVVLFGSSVRGEQRETSDIDLLIVLSEERAIDRSLYQIWDNQVQSKIGEAYSPQFVHLPYGPDFSSLWLEVAMEGEILEDRQNLIRPLLRRIRNTIAVGKYIRKFSHGHPYWIRQQETHD